MSRWVWSALVIAALLVGVWQGTFWIARELIEGPREELVEGEEPPPEAVSPQLPLPAHSVSGTVEQVLSSVGLGGKGLVESREELREDEEGQWGCRIRTWEVSGEEDPKELGRRVKRLLRELLPAAEVYLHDSASLETELRLYEGKRLRYWITLRPQLSEQVLGERVWIALVVRGLGRNGETGGELLRFGHPLTVAIEPFTPFALRHAREAMVRQKEVLVDLQDQAADEDSLLAVPRSTGLLIDRAPGELPLPIMLRSGTYLLDLESGAQPKVLREARAAGVPILGATQLTGDELDVELERAWRLAAGRDGAALVTHIEDPNLPAILKWLSEEHERIRPVFVTELIDRRRLGRD